MNAVEMLSTLPCPEIHCLIGMCMRNQQVDGVRWIQQHRIVHILGISRRFHRKGDQHMGKKINGSRFKNQGSENHQAPFRKPIFSSISQIVSLLVECTCAKTKLSQGSSKPASPKLRFRSGPSTPASTTICDIAPARRDAAKGRILQLIS